MPKTWILVSDSSKARLFSTDTPTGALTERESFEHPAGHVHARDLTSDLPGRSFDSAGQGRHIMESEVGPKAHEARLFAKQLAERLEAGRARGETNRLILVAPPDFLGLLRDALSAEARKMVELAIDKHLVKLTPAEIRARLPEKLFSTLG